MRQKFLGVVAGLLTSAGLSFAQAPVLPPPSPAPAVPGVADSSADGAAAVAPGVPMPGMMPFAAGSPFMPPPPPCAMPECPPTMDAAMGVPVEKQCHPAGCKEHCFWADIQYLLWQVDKPRINVPLVTIGSPAAGQQGVIGAATTNVVVGDGAISLEAFNGVRARAGFHVGCVWLPALELGGFCLYRRDTGVTINSDAAGNSVLARPFLNTVTGAEAVEIISAPGLANGGFAVTDKMHLWSVEANCVTRICDEQNFNTAFTADILIGARMLKLNENFRTRTNSSVLVDGIANFAGANGLPAGTAVSSIDQIDARNEFYGGQLGVRMEWECGRFAIGFCGKIAAGQTFETRSGISQTSLLTGAGGTVPGSILVPNSSSGIQHQSIFALLPEGEVTIRYHVTDFMTIDIGYSYLYINKVLQPSNTLNRNIDPTQLPTSANFNPAAGGTGRAATDLNQSDLDAYGLHVGVGFRF